MKVTIARQNGILTVPNDFASFVGVTARGQFHYKIKYSVNAIRAIKKRAYLTKISVSTVSPETKVVSSFYGTNGQDLVAGLLRQSSSKIEAGRAFTKGLVTSITSDITSKFPNDRTRELNNLNQGTTLFQRKGHKLVKAADLTKENVSQPILQTPLFQPATNSISSISPSENANILLLRFGIDPATVGQKTHQIVDTKKVQDGIHQSLGGVAKAASWNVLAGSTRAAFGILGAVVKPNAKPSDQLGLANDEMVLVDFQEGTNDLVVEEDLFIDAGAVGDQFYLLFQLHDMGGVEVDTASVLVQHSRNLALSTLPTLPPILTVKPCGGYNRLEIKQLDENGAGVIIFRKTVDTQTVSMENGFVQVAKFPIRKQDGTKWYEDRFPSMKPVIYRAVVYNRQEFKSGEFSSAMCTPLTKALLVRSKAGKRKSYLSLHAKIVEKSVQLELNDIPASVLAMKVYRRDLSLFQSLEEAEQIGNIIFMPELPTTDMRFYVTDQNPVDKRDYEYIVRLIYRDGAEAWATPPVQIKYNPVSNGILTTTSSPMKAVNVGLEQDIQFSLSTTIAEGKIDQVRRAMAQQGILGFFQDDLVNNREYLQSLVAYHVKRTNLTTAEVEDMGIFMGSDFSDRTQGAGKGVQPVRSGCEYEYAITTYFRSSQTMLATFEQTVTDTTNPDRTYSYSPAKWQNPIVLGEGNLVTTASLQRNHASSEFTSATVGSVIHLRLSLAESTPLIQNATAIPIGVGKVLVQWELKGNAKEIDHFLVTREELGMVTVVGKAHALTDSKSIQFVDSFDSKHIDKRENYEGAVAYLITPVLYDYTLGATTKTPQVIVKKSR